MNSKELLGNILDSTDLNHNDIYVLFGADAKGAVLYDLLTESGYYIDFFIDNDAVKQNSLLCGKKVSSPSIMAGDTKHKIILSLALAYVNTVLNQLLSMGIDRKNIIIPINCDFAPFGLRKTITTQIEDNQPSIEKVQSILEDKRSIQTLRGIVKYCKTLDLSEIHKIYDNRYPQYFDGEIVTFGENEVFVDGGCLDFGTSFEFINKVHGKYKRIYAFEPDSANFTNIVKRTESLTNVTIFQKGIFSEKKSMSFIQTGSFGSMISNTGLSRIEVDTLDNLVEAPTFIKFDIEGSEFAGLLGAEKIIKKYKPKLAICVYHRLSDLWKIPLLIKEYDSSYHIYFRHYYNHGHMETVCYAIPQKP